MLDKQVDVLKCISEHRNHINRNTTQHSVIIQHHIDLFHEFDWNNRYIYFRQRANFT